MIIQINKDVLYNYNKKKKELFFIFYTKNSFIYTVKGWFGKNLYKLLKSGENLEKFLKVADFKADSKLVEVFKRLIMTLIQENILEPISDKELSCLRPLSTKEREGFVVGGLKGTFVRENLDVQELLAHADVGCHGNDYYGVSRIDKCEGASDSLYSHGEIHCNVFSNYPLCH